MIGQLYRPVIIYLYRQPGHKEVIVDLQWLCHADPGIGLIFEAENKGE
jgi:hypothetical protein